MDHRHYKIVFSGDLALDTDEEQARERLASQCKLRSETIDKMLSGRTMVLKSGLDKKEANRYKTYFDQLGLLCDVVDQRPPVPIQEDRPIIIKHEEKKSSGRICPKCSALNQNEEACQQCGVIFSRYEEIQARREAGSESTLRNNPETDSYFNRHPELLFVLQAFGVIVLILTLRHMFYDYIRHFVLLFPVGFLLYIRMQAAVNDVSPTDLLAQHITFMPVMYSKEERQQQYVPRMTYGLIFSNILIYYLFELQVPQELILNHLLFLPYEPSIINVPLSMVVSIFLHADDAHLWGNMLFLWAVGTVVERRIGAKQFVSFYLVSGIIANLVSLSVGWVAGFGIIHGLGASGAIAGVMGLFAVRCYFKSMVFPLPILGIFSLFLPVSLKVKLNSLVIIGLFFLADLSGGIQQLTGTSASNIGHWAHIGGMVCGILLAIIFKLNQKATVERQIELGSRAVNAAIGAEIGHGEESLRQLLDKDPDNIEARLLLARLRSKFTATDEGEQLYQQVIPQLISHDPEEAMIVYHEYRKMYLQGLDPMIMYRLANIFQHHRDPEMATLCLEHVCKDDKTPDSIREKAFYQCARLLESIGFVDAAEGYYRSCIDMFPKSSLSTKAKARLVEWGV